MEEKRFLIVLIQGCCYSVLHGTDDGDEALKEYFRYKDIYREEIRQKTATITIYKYY